MTALTEQDIFPRVIDLERIEHTFTSKHHRWVFLTTGETPPSVIQALSQRLPHIEPSTWPRRLLWGGVYINGLPCMEDRALPTPCKLEYFETKFAIEDADSVFPKFDQSWIVYRDEVLLICFKPAGLPAMPAREQSQYCLKTYLERYLGHTVHLPSRLDLSTAGLTLISCSATNHNSIQKLFTNRLIDKRYLLLVGERPSWESCAVQSTIGRHPSHPVLRSVSAGEGKAAHTTFVRLCKHPPSDFWVAEARPLTGRTHQIRVHAQALGLPLVGDNFYGGAPHSDLGLLSYAASFRHPLFHKEVEIVLPQELAPRWASQVTLQQLKAQSDSILPSQKRR